QVWKRAASGRHGSHTAARTRHTTGRPAVRARDTSYEAVSNTSSTSGSATAPGPPPPTPPESSGGSAGSVASATTTAAAAPARRSARSDHIAAPQPATGPVATGASHDGAPSYGRSPARSVTAPKPAPRWRTCRQASERWSAGTACTRWPSPGREPAARRQGAVERVWRRAGVEHHGPQARPPGRPDRHRDRPDAERGRRHLVEEDPHRRVLRPGGDLAEQLGDRAGGVGHVDPAENDQP